MIVQKFVVHLKKKCVYLGYMFTSAFKPRDQNKSIFMQGLKLNVWNLVGSNKCDIKRRVTFECNFNSILVLKNWHELSWPALVEKLVCFGLTQHSC